MHYAKALPALITDNIGDAPLTVSIIMSDDSVGFIIDATFRFGHRHFNARSRQPNSRPTLS